VSICNFRRKHYVQCLLQVGCKGGEVVCCLMTHRLSSCAYDYRKVEETSNLV